MLTRLPSLSQREQQQAVERIHQLMQQGISSRQAIAIVAQQIRDNHQGDPMTAVVDIEDDN